MRPAKSQRRMPNDIFTFKQFAITQASAAMKVGTDAVMLGAAATLPDSGRVLDIGTGTGIVAIMAAQRRPDVTVTVIEIDPCAADEARANVAATPWSDRIEVVCGDVRTWDGDGRAFDCIVSNPPYYEGMLRGDDHGRNIARHDETLDMATLTATSALFTVRPGSAPPARCAPFASHLPPPWVRCPAALGAVFPRSGCGVSAVPWGGRGSGARWCAWMGKVLKDLHIYICIYRFMPA